MLHHSQDCFLKLVFEAPKQGAPAGADGLTECLGRHGWVQGSSQVDALWGVSLGEGGLHLPKPDLEKAKGGVPCTWLKGL